MLLLLLLLTVVSPLLALMEDQVSGFKRRGVKASIIISSTSVTKENICTEEQTTCFSVLPRPSFLPSGEHLASSVFLESFALAVSGDTPTSPNGHSGPFHWIGLVHSYGVLG